MSNTEHVEPKISPEEVAERRDELFVLDVRREDDHEEWAIEGSHNVPIYDQLLDEEFEGLAAALGEIPEDREIAVVCVAGITSARAAAWLRDRGYDARSMTDGMNGWGRLHRTYDVAGAPGVVQVIRPGTGCVSYLAHDDGEALVVDPSQYVDEYREAAAVLDADIVGVVDTHAHADHVSGGRRLRDELGVPYYLHETDSGSLDEFEPITADDTIEVGDRALTVHHTPGHTPGSVSLEFGDVLFSGDTVFLESVGRPDLHDGDESAVREAAGDLFDSLEDLSNAPDDTLVLPGHFSDDPGRPVATTLFDLRTNNELFGLVEDGERAAFVDTIVEELGETPSNYERIKRINLGEEPLSEEARDLELGPNNCAAN